MVVRSHHNGVIPVGALGFPVRMFWHLAATTTVPKDDSATGPRPRRPAACVVVRPRAWSSRWPTFQY